MTVLRDCLAAPMGHAQTPVARASTARRARQTARRVRWASSSRLWASARARRACLVGSKRTRASRHALLAPATAAISQTRARHFAWLVQRASTKASLRRLCAPVASLGPSAARVWAHVRTAMAASSVLPTRRRAPCVRRGDSAKPVRCRRRARTARLASTARRVRARAQCVRAASGARQTARRARRARKVATAAHRSTKHPMHTAAIARQARRKRVKAPHTATRAVQGGTRVLPA